VKVVAGVLVIAGACTSPSDAPTAGIARVTQGADAITIALGGEDNAYRLGEVLGGEKPLDFHWYAITFPARDAQALHGSDGVSVELTNLGARVGFQQVYRSTCNPATEDFSPCWLFESYAAGEPGLTGFITLRLISDRIEGSFDVSWQGDTDRFGEPVQPYAHETVAGVAATVFGVDTP